MPGKPNATLSALAPLGLAALCAADATPYNNLQQAADAAKKMLDGYLNSRKKTWWPI